MMKIDDPRIEVHGARPALFFEMGTERAHVWLDPATLLPERDRDGRACLFVNPPLGVKYGAPGYFRTRRLDPDSKRWRPVIDAAYAAIGDLAAARRRLDREAAEDEARKEAARRAAVRAGLLMEYGPPLYGALSDLLRALANGEDPGRAAAGASALLAEIDGDENSTVRTPGAGVR